MGKILKKCHNCGRYTMKEGACPSCGSTTGVRSVYPPKFSPEDKYASYRRAMKKRIEKKSIHT